MKKKTPDEILYEKMRNYCLAPWKSTREELPPYGMPVLMAWHHDRGEGVAEIDGFPGYSFGIGARYYYEEKKENGKTVCITSHLTLNDVNTMSPENFRQMDDAYHIGLYYDRYTYSNFNDRQRRTGMFGLKDPYLKKKNKEDEVRYDYWINFAEGKFGSKFKNTHAADLSFIPESTVKEILKEGNGTSPRYQQVILNSEECPLAFIPDYWMEIPKLK